MQNLLALLIVLSLPIDLFCRADGESLSEGFLVQNDQHPTAVFPGSLHSTENFVWPSEQGPDVSRDTPGNVFPPISITVPPYPLPVDVPIQQAPKDPQERCMYCKAKAILLLQDQSNEAFTAARHALLAICDAMHDPELCNSLLYTRLRPGLTGLVVDVIHQTCALSGFCDSADGESQPNSSHSSIASASSPSDNSQSAASPQYPSAEQVDLLDLDTSNRNAKTTIGNLEESSSQYESGDVAGTR
jgi:hypothetical protein